VVPAAAGSDTGVTIRPASATDFDSIDAVHGASVRELTNGHYDAGTIDDWARTLDRDLFEQAVATTEYLIAEAGGEAVGFAQLDPGAGEVKMLYVHPRWAGSGIGRRLLEELEGIARERGLERLWLRASLNAVAFYARCGWRETERITHTLRTGRQVPCARMEKDLVGEP